MRRLKNCLLAGFAFFGALTAAGANEQIVVQTDSTSIVYTVGQDGRLHQSYLGRRLANPAEYANLPEGTEAYLTHGMEDYYEPHSTSTDRQAIALRSSCIKAIAPTRSREEHAR